MHRVRQNNTMYRLVLGAFLFVAARPTWGLILHPDGEPNMVTWADRPAEKVIGRWGSFSGCVAISSDCVITTRHQIGRADTPVTIGGRTYAIAEIWDHETADLRIARLHNANLSHFVGVYVGKGEVSRQIVIAGYGAGRGRVLEKDGIAYGYEWDGPGSDSLRFGTNTVYHAGDNARLGDAISDILIADFDGPNEVGSTAYECTLGGRDSGSGWFIKTGRTWKLVGLSRAVDIHYEAGHDNDPDYALYEAHFREPQNPSIRRPDHLDAVRISSYARWINDTIPVPLPGDLNGDDRVDFADFAVFCSNWMRSDCAPPNDCLRADFERDGDVDAADLVQLADMWLLTDVGPNALLP